MPRTVRHSGHLLEWSVVRAKQARQNECPHGVVTGSNSRLEHRLHSTSSDCSTMRALSHAPAQLSVPELVPNGEDTTAAPHVSPRSANFQDNAALK